MLYVCVDRRKGVYACVSARVSGGHATGIIQVWFLKAHFFGGGPLSGSVFSLLSLRLYVYVSCGLSIIVVALLLLRIVGRC